MSFILKAYDVTVAGWVAKRFHAATAARARVRCWHAYQVVDDCSFGDFLRKSKIKRVTETSEDFGLPVLVGGLPAYLVGSSGPGGHVRFVRDDTDVTLLSHPMDVLRLAPEDVANMYGFGDDR